MQQKILHKVIYPGNFEQKIDFLKVRELVKESCLSDLGRTFVDEMEFIQQYEVARTRLHEVDEFLNILSSDEEFPVENYFDLRPAISKLRINGTFLEVKELFSLRKSLQTVKNILIFFKGDDKAGRYPNLKQLSDTVTLYPYVFDGIDRILTSQGKIKDNASADLAKIRADLYSKQSTVSKLIHRIIAQAQKDGWVDADTSLSIRDGRTVIPVSATNKRKIPGIIHDESATGKTCYVEPTPVVELNNAISELEAEERREIVRILRQFTDTIRPYADDLEDSIVYLGITDFIRAKARFATRINGQLPKFINESKVSWINARHPLLFLSFQQEGRKVVPLKMELHSEQRILLISGPNAGGKSVCLKTVGMLQYMLQCGLLIPVEEGSEAGFFKNIFIDIGDEQSIENDLSTYSSHLLNMKHFTKNGDDKTLLLIDEFGTGTEPMLGGAIAESVLQKLNSLNVYGVITTHYTNLKHFASQTEGIVNGAMLYDSQKLEPLFQLETGKPGSSFAFEIAYKIGLPQDVIDLAKEKVGEEHFHFDKHLREISRDKKYWERKRENIRKIEKRLEDMMDKEKRELDHVQSMRKEIISKAEDEAKRILDNSNKVIENTIRKIKEAQADKEKTRDARKQVDELKDKVLEKNLDTEEKILRKIEKLRERETRVKQGNKDEVTGNRDKPVVEPVRVQEFTIGMPVRIQGQSSVGEIMEISGKSVVVAFGDLIMTTKLNKLEALSTGEKKNLMKRKKSLPVTGKAYDMNQRRMSFKPGLDVRGKRVEEALQMVQEFVDEAIMLGVFELKILHGTGTGALRQFIREYLNTVDMVQSVKDEHIEFGGAGISVVTLG